MPANEQNLSLSGAARPGPGKILNPQQFGDLGTGADKPVLVILAAGKGTRFGTAPKCA